MLKKNYLNNFIKTYSWNFLAVMFNLASMFIVIPMLADNTVVFGIYSICISLAIFLSYADLGFIRSSVKFAGEHFARGEKDEEIKLHGFSAFILFIFVLVFVFLLFIFSLNPTWLISDIKNPSYLQIASDLLFIQAFASLIVVLQRFVSGIFQVRIEEYVFQIVILIGSFFKILSVFNFFANNAYEIVNYFLFTKIIDLFVVFIGLFLVIKRYSITSRLILSSFKFDKKIFSKTKNLALSSIFVTFMWILYYEIDLIIIGKFLGATSVAFFAIGLTFSKFLRNLISIIFSPFQHRFNHFVGNNDIDGLREILISAIRFSMPILVFMILPIIYFSDNIVVAWVGIDYLPSVSILSLLSVNFIFSFISGPTSNIYTSLEKIKELYLSSFLMTFVFWAGILTTVGYLGLISFAIFKVVASIVVMFYYIKFLIKFLRINFFSFAKLLIFPIIIPLIIQLIFLFITKNFLPFEEGISNLILIIIISALSGFIGLIALFLSSDYYNKIISKNLIRLLKKYYE